MENNLLKKTRKDYSLIASRFSSTRRKPWKEMKFIFDQITPGSRVLDLGCGNGRFYELLKEKEVSYLGVDQSKELIEEAKEKYKEASFIQADALNLPLEKESFDYVISIAVFHHMPTPFYRRKFLKEVSRVLKRNGLFVCTVWSFSSQKEILFKNISLKIRGKLGIRDALIPFKDDKGEIITSRYYHFFTPLELKRVVSGAGFKVEKIFEKGKGKKGNIFLFARKNESDIISKG